MNQAGMVGTQRAARDILAIGQTLDADQWQLPSAASGWSVQDVVVHTECLLDLLMAPRGPVDRELPPLGEEQLVPAVSWLLGGIPKMQPDLPQHIAAPLALNLTGAAACQVVISVKDGAISVTPQADTDLAAIATITSSTSNFLAWSTTRLPWRASVSIEGDRTAASEFLDALNLI